MFARTDKSVTGKWWWTVDKWNLTAIILLTIIGCLLILSASPSAAPILVAVLLSTLYYCLLSSTLYSLLLSTLYYCLLSTTVYYLNISYK